MHLIKCYEEEVEVASDTTGGFTLQTMHYENRGVSNTVILITQ